jgi:signal transduction histidine kinase
MDENFLERVLSLSRKMTETRALGPLLEYAMDEAMSLVGADHGYIVLVDKEGQLDFRVARGLDDSTAPTDQVSTSLLNEVIRTCKPLVLQDATGDENWNKYKSVTDLRLRSVMAVPLISRGDTIGAIYVENRVIKGRFENSDLTPLILFANQAAVSIENAALNDDLEARVAARMRQIEQMMSQVEQSWTEAVEVNRLRTLLLGNVAHDIRSPLSVVIEALNLLREGIFGEVNPEQLDWLTRSWEAATHILHLTNDIFDLTKIEMGHLSLSPEVVDVPDFLERIYKVAMALPWSPNVELSLALDENLPAITADPTRITQVLMNLLSNALKYTERGSVTIHASFNAANGEALIGVRDTGAGIPAEKIDYLFKRFHVVDEQRDQRKQGTGLGLAISRELVEMHGGRIWVESKLDKGSDFQFVLPLQAKSDNG